ncbi:phytoene/squalene synthase family protein [Falsiroseomonas oryziterrae]|uniref:phytoene/squalene synthase family protein n=1 Tax=Falsiroseomonas oryziterrae TaxID=2911368 RepID=UPI001F48359F|nr:phytoene/squalene synthase family protein [Roseomonas sp. NPKOSM-4]
MPPATPETVHADMAACRMMLSGGSKSFAAAARLLPKRVAEPATALYAFCRVADDIIDEGGGADALAELRARLDGIYAGRPVGHPADRAFARIVARHAIPRALPEALLEGLAWDAEGRQCVDEPALEAYAARVAAAVGAIMTLLMGVRDPQAIARACDLGVAMQYTNIARDVGEDARNGRLYLPHDWLREEGIEPSDFLADPAFTPALGRVVARLLATADALYRRAEAGIALLPPDCRSGIAAARFVYAEIGRQVERQGLDSISRRAVVPAHRKLRLMARSLGQLRLRPGDREAPALPGTAFLVDAVVAMPPAEQPVSGFRGRVLWAVELFDRLDRMEQAMTGPVRPA